MSPDKKPIAMTIYSRIKKIGSIAWSHKILCIIIIYLVWIAFFDEKSLLTQMKIRESIHSLNAEKEYYLEKIHNDSIMNYELRTNDNNLEKFAREQYFMKADDEDVYEIVEQ